MVANHGRWACLRAASGCCARARGGYSDSPTADVTTTTTTTVCLRRHQHICARLLPPPHYGYYHHHRRRRRRRRAPRAAAVTIATTTTNGGGGSATRPLLLLPPSTPLPTTTTTLPTTSVHRTQAPRPPGVPRRRGTVAIAQKPRTTLVVSDGGRRGASYRRRARVACSLLPAGPRDFPDIFPVNFPLLAGDGSSPGVSPSHSLCLHLPVRTYRLLPRGSIEDPGFPTGGRRQ